MFVIKNKSGSYAATQLRDIGDGVTVLKKITVSDISSALSFSKRREAEEWLDSYSGWYPDFQVTEIGGRKPNKRDIRLAVDNTKRR